MSPKWCSCPHRDAEVCHGIRPLPIQSSTCFCACHKAERRDPEEIQRLLTAGLAGMTVKSERGDQGPVFFMISGNNTEIVLEYEPEEGFGLTLTGWGEDSDRYFTLPDVVKRIKYLNDGGI